MRIVVYQPNKPRFLIDESVKKYDRNDYHKKWSHDYDRELENKGAIEGILEWVFEMSNMGICENWNGYSMSVGDICEVDGELYICQHCGWGKIEWK